MTALQNRRVTKGRHPLLKNKSLPFRVWTQLKQTPGITIAQIAKFIHEEYQSVNGATQRMKAEGLIITQHGNKGQRVVTTYFPAIENETAFTRDKIEIELVVYVNLYGEYSVRAVVKGQAREAVLYNLKPIQTTNVYVAVPRPNEPAKTREMFDDNYEPSTKKSQGLIIDGTIVNNNE
jgi:hypothetical protein